MVDIASAGLRPDDFPSPGWLPRFGAAGGHRADASPRVEPVDADANAESRRFGVHTRKANRTDRSVGDAVDGVAWATPMHPEREPGV